MDKSLGLPELDEIRKAIETKIDEYTNSLKEEIAKIINAYRIQLDIIWKTLASPKPLDPNDKAILWLKRRLSKVQVKHPELRFEFILDGGRITGLRYIATDRKVETDVEASTRWAFQKASERPQGMQETWR